MENENTSVNDLNSSNNELKISDKSAEYLSETEKWTKFLSITGFVFVGLIVIMAFFAGSIFSQFPFGQENNYGGAMSLLFTVGYLLLAALYFFPIWYLFKFSKSIKEAIIRKNSEELEVAFSNHKSFFKFIGIVMAIVLGFYAIGLLFSVLAIF
jgi:hypothetical protein